MIGLLSLLLKAVGPELLRMIADHYDKTGQIMTEEQLHSKIDAHADAIIAKGEDWLSKHPAE